MGDGQPDAENDEGLEELLGFLRDARGFDPTHSHRSSLGRRVRERMADVHIASYDDYRDCLENSAAEFDALFDAILNDGTSFFRDPEVWAFLRREVLPELLARGGAEKELRVWSAGCAGGEEAYSLAIVFAETLGLDEVLERVRIHGTDVDDEALRRARAGLYPAKALRPLDAGLRDRFFEPHGARFAVRPDLRRRVAFGRHDLGCDAPSSRLDLLLCRNTLLYFDVEAQARIVDRFHHALREGGFLLLGKAETLPGGSGDSGDAGDSSDFGDLGRFEPLSPRHRVFRRRPGEPHSVGRHRQLRDLVLDATPGAAVAVDSDGVVVLVNSRARDGFGLTSDDIGRPFRDLELSYRPVELCPLVEQAGHERRALRFDRVERRVGEDVQYLDILVHPLTGPDGRVMATHITFTDVTAATRLKAEVAIAYEELRSGIGELAATNEELQYTNEELQCTNEELQNTNKEMRVRAQELDESRAFLESVLASLAAGVVVLDKEFKVRSWNRAAVEQWGLRPDEVFDRPFFGLALGLPQEKLRGTVHRCAETGRRGPRVPVAAVDRLGRPVVCTVQCSPLDGHDGGVVLLLEAVRTGICGN